MSTTAGAPPTVLIAARERSLEAAVQENGFGVIWADTGALVLERAPADQPDAVVLGEGLPDMTMVDVCRGLHSHLRVGPYVPILIVASRPPTSQQQSEAFQAGAWDYLPWPASRGEFLLRLQAYVQAKRKIDAALTEGLVDPATGVHSRPALARRARELGALMSRAHGALCCVVFSVDGEAAAARMGSLLARSAREYDVVGALSPTEFAVLAPATDEVGAVVLGERLAVALRKAMGGVDAPGAELRVTVGYDVVTNLTYTPIDPVELLRRARSAVRYGRPEPGRRWLRRFDSDGVPDGGLTPLRITPPSGTAARDPRKTQPRSRPLPDVD